MQESKENLKSIVLEITNDNKSIDSIKEHSSKLTPELKQKVAEKIIDVLREHKLNYCQSEMVLDLTKEIIKLLPQLSYL